MTPLSTAVASEIERNLFLRDVLESGLGNISAIAERLKPRIDRELKRNVSVSAIGMALRRGVEKTPVVVSSPSKFPPHIDITTRTRIYEVAVAKTEHGQTLADRIRKSVVVERNDFMTVAEGLYEIVIFASERLRPQIAKLIGKTKRTSEIPSLACVTVNWPPITKDIPGIYYQVTRSLALNKISIQSFHTIGAEMMIFVKEESLQLAEDSISRLLSQR